MRRTPLARIAANAIKSSGFCVGEGAAPPLGGPGLAVVICAWQHVTDENLHACHRRPRLVVPASTAMAEAKKVAEETGKAVFVRDPITDKGKAVVHPCRK